MNAAFFRVVPWLITGLLSACDEGQAFHQPDPGLERMLVQPRGERYGASSAFADGRTMREPVPDTVSREQSFIGQTQIETGRSATDYVQNSPLLVTRASLEVGRVAFERVCATCHGVLGDGHSVVAEKMELRKPPSLHEARIAQLPAGKVFQVASVGYGLMPGYAALLSVEERWAVIGYLDALRLSQAAPVTSLPPYLQAALRKVAP
ncbi:MAG TPA: cytochrome c [Polyangiaceae bacterium]